MDEETLEDAIVALLRRSVIELPGDVLWKLNKALDSETNDVARVQLDTIINNIELARELGRPMCQDTGIHIFFLKLPRGFGLPVESIIERAVRRGTEEIPLRPNAVDPISRKNSGDNVGEHMPYIAYEFHDQEYVEVTAFPKGAGSENMTALKMLTPAQGMRGIKEFILDTVLRAGGKPCPPTIVGVGIGGSSDLCLKLAKMALLRPLDAPNPDPVLESLEKELEEALNELGIGPMGLGGRTTVLGVHLLKAACHTASLPVAVNLQCWAARRATLRAYPDGRIDHL
ncbi:MAG TPA: fumarate hydratase [Candidatus Methanofastidiosa archaeon]|nr:fumarate hydratase [Candidatus Methanofastidiosa archaeon]